MKAGATLTRHDTLLASAFAVLAALRSLPFASRYAYHWDSAQFALAVEGEFNVAHGQPHAPGFPLYVFLGRALNVVVGEPHQSLVWLSILAAAALAALGYLLGASLFDRRVGVVTGAMLIVSPLVGFHGAMALTTIVDAALIAGLALVAWTALRRGGTPATAVGLGVLFAAAVGVRPQSAPGLLPLMAYACWKSGGRQAAIAMVVAAAGCAAWFAPLVAWSGGWGNYRAALAAKAAFDAGKTPVGGGGWPAAWENLGMIVASCWVGLLACGGLALGVAAWRLMAKRARQGAPTVPGRARFRSAFGFLALWAGPLCLFGMLSYMTMPGYVLGYFTAVAVAAGWVLARGAPVALTAAALAANAWVFVAEPAWSQRVTLGLPLNAPEIRRHDAMLEQTLAALRAREGTILHAVQSFQFGFRHFQYHLPERRHVQIQPDPSLPGERGGKLWASVGRRTEFIAPWAELPAGEFLLVVPPGLGVEIFAPLIDPGAAKQVDELLWRVGGSER